MAEVRVLVLGGGLCLFSGGTMGFTATFPTFNSGGRGGGGGGGGTAAKRSESVRSKLIMCSFRLSGDFFGRAAAAAERNSRSLLSRVSPGPFLTSSFCCTEAGMIWGSTR